MQGLVMSLLPVFLIVVFKMVDPVENVIKKRAFRPAATRI